MIVFVAGMPRSGSTFTFNIVRGLLESRGHVHSTPVESALAALEHTEAAKHLIFKGHATDEITIKLVKLGALKMVCSVRKPEDAIASWMETFGFTLVESIATLERWLAMYRELKDHALIVPFETINGDPFAAARAIAAHICPDASSEEVEEICQLYTKERVRELSERVANREGEIEDLGFSYYDKTTLFHSHHVTSLIAKTADDRVAADEIALIRERFALFCDEDGNLRN